MLTAPDVEVSAPPNIVSPALAVSAFVPFARMPPERVSSPAVVSWLWRVRVPPLTVSAPKDALPPIRRFPVPENVTVELVAVKVVAEDVSQFAELIVIVADANVNVEAPLEVRLFVPNATVPAFVKASVPVHVRDPAKVVETAGLTVRLFTVCVMFMEPPDAFTTTFEAPTVNVPRWVSIDVTVIVDPLAVRAPPAFTTNVTALIARFEPLVFSVVVPAPPEIVSVPPTSRVPPVSTRPRVVRAKAAGPVRRTVRGANPLGAFRSLTVAPAPDIVRVLAPPVNVEPAPDVSQLPVTVHAPVVSVSVPDAPPVIATFDALTADAFAVRMPASPMVSAPPVRVRSLVARVVAPAPPWTDKVPDQMRRLVGPGNGTVDAPLLNPMSLNSAAAPGREATGIGSGAKEVQVEG